MNDDEDDVENEQRDVQHTTCAKISTGWCPPLSSEKEAKEEVVYEPGGTTADNCPRTGT